MSTEQSRTTSAGQRVARFVSLIGGVAVVGVLAFWAGMTVQDQQAPVTKENSEPVLVTVTQQSVGRSLTLGVSVEQKRVPVAANLKAGVLTAITMGTVQQGGEVYAVDGVAVRAVEGTTPFYRDLADDDSGPDVAQLNLALQDMGYLSGWDDEYDVWTTEAVKEWQRDLDVEPTGMIARGDLIAVPSLPTVLFVDPTVGWVGAQLSGGEKLVLSTGGDPEFQMILNQQQSAMIPQGPQVDVAYKEWLWPAVLGDAVTSDSGELSYPMTAPDGGPVCGQDCLQLPSSEHLNLFASVQVVAQQTGSAVPVAALQVQADGTVVVQRVRDGVMSPVVVDVGATQDGIALVKGIEVGDQVQLFSGTPTIPAGQVPAQPESGR